MRKVQDGVDARRQFGFRPVVIVVAFRAPRIRCSLGSAVASLAGRDAREQNIGSVIARFGLRVALGTCHELVRLVIELGVCHPPDRDRGFRNLRTSVRSRVSQHVAFFTGLLPQQPLGFLNALGKLSLIANYKIVNDLRVLMGRRFGESAVEHQRMATGAMLRIGDRSYGRVRRVRNRLVAVHTLKLLNAPIGSSEVRLHVYLVTELDGSRIGRVTGPHCGELRMPAIE